MTTLFMGTSISDFDFNSGAVISTSSSFIDTAVVSEGVSFGTNSASRVRKTLPSAFAEGWIGFMMTRESGGSANVTCPIITLLGTGGTLGLFHVRHNAVGASSSFLSVAGDVMIYSAGSTVNMTGGGDLFAISTSARQKVAINFKLDNTVGFFKLYIAGALIYDSGLTDTILNTATTCDTVEWGGSGGSASHAVIVSEFYVGTEDARDIRVAELALSSNGTNTGWTNDITAIDETGYDDGDFISAASSGLKESFVVGNVPAGLPDFDVLSVAMSARARRGSSGPQNIKGLVRTGGTDFSSASISGLEMAFRGGIQAIWETNPDTTTSWTQAEVNGAEIGVESAA